MDPLDPYLGQVLDEKYRLERLLGQGGMGAVYLATHLGTERYVALKLITPQFMRNEEFVARFKREARAAGRLRHPNVVDVTDFGFARANEQPVAYLVMEYLDGCTLADVLKEEKRLPQDWVVDILEQVCSAVHEAHNQGIVHRDLKPENIWLEPNRLGGYRVKVLDFGIAKLAEVDAPPQESGDTRSVTPANLETETLIYGSTQSDPVQTGQVAPVAVTSVSNEADATRILAPPNLSSSSGEDGKATPTNVSPQLTAAFESDDDGKTLRFEESTSHAIAERRATAPGGANATAALTRVGAIMGTPLYMSPEQCAGKRIDARTDIYSLGVIAYQMLAGDPPFVGNTTNVMREHIQTPPPPLSERSKKVGKRVAQVVMSALAKDPNQRPQSAAAFANSLRAQAQSIGSLYRRAFALYSEYFPKFVKLSLIAHIPVIVTTLLMVAVELISRSTLEGGMAAKVITICVLGILTLLQVVSYFVAAASISGMTAVIVTQLSAAPLKPVDLRTVFALFRKRWKPFLKTSLRVTIRILIGYVLLIIPGLIITVRYALYAPVVLLEGLEKKAAMKRARELASRSWRTVIIVSILQVLIPGIVGGLVGLLSKTAKTTSGIHISGPRISQQLSQLVNIFIIPLISIVPALLYLKMRQLGGESLTDALKQIEEAEGERSQWQQRMRSSLSVNTPRSGSRRVVTGEKSDK